MGEFGKIFRFWLPPSSPYGLSTPLVNAGGEGRGDAPPYRSFFAFLRCRSTATRISMGYRSEVQAITLLIAL